METVFYGNDNAKQLLNSTVSHGKFNHAYLICGDNGLGKKTFAVFFAMSLLCENQEKPCGICASCKKILSRVHPDVKFFEGGENRFSIHVELIREIRGDCVIKPNEAAVKIYILTNVQNMTDGAFNAFLKTLEEPPKNVVFLLTAPSVNTLPETISSRLTAISLFPLADNIMHDAIKERFKNLSDDDIAAITMLAGGNLGHAIEQASNTDFAQKQEDLTRFCKLLATKKEYYLLRFFTAYDKDKLGFLLLMNATLNVLRAVIRVGDSSKKSEAANILSASFTQKQAMDLILIFEQVKKKLAANANYSLLISYLCASIIKALL